MPRPTRFHGRLAGRVALVTGAGSQGEGFGAGKAIACLFAFEGAQVALIDQSRERAQATAAEIEAASGAAIVRVGDVTKPDDCAACVAETVAAFGKLDILVNNVGIAGAAQPLEQLDEAEWDRVLAVNLKSAMLMSKAAMPQLRSAKPGAIVNISSISGMRGTAGAFAYAASKAGMEAFTRSLATAYGRAGVRANAVVPGHIFTPMAEAALPASARRVRTLVSPLAIEGDAWDVAQAALFLAGDEARYITGVCLPVDGGVTQLGALAAHKLIEDAS